MDTQRLHSDLEGIFRKVLKTPQLTWQPETLALSLPNWNSLNLMMILANIEKKFRVRFQVEEVISLSTLGQFEKTVLEKLQVPSP